MFGFLLCNIPAYDKGVNKGAMHMYSYEFIIKKHAAYFKGVDNKLIAIDKEDMVHVLSAMGHWTAGENKVYLLDKNNNYNIELSEYLVSCPAAQIKHLNGNFLDYRKKNLSIFSSNLLDCYIRPWTNISSNHCDEVKNILAQKWFVMKSFHHIIGYFGLFPISDRECKRLLNFPSEAFENFIPIYENDSSYHHLLIGNIPFNKETASCFYAFYQLFARILSFRNITIHSLFTPIDTPLVSLINRFASIQNYSTDSLHQSNQFQQVFLV